MSIIHLAFFQTQHLKKNLCYWAFLPPGSSVKSRIMLTSWGEVEFLLTTITLADSSLYACSGTHFQELELRLKDILSISKYKVGHKVLLDFPVTAYGKSERTFWPTRYFCIYNCISCWLEKWVRSHLIIIFFFWRVRRTEREWCSVDSAQMLRKSI